MPRGFWELNPDPLEGGPMLLSFELSLQPCLSWLVKTGSHYTVTTGLELGVLPGLATFICLLSPGFQVWPTILGCPCVREGMTCTLSHYISLLSEKQSLPQLWDVSRVEMPSFSLNLSFCICKMGAVIK